METDIVTLPKKVRRRYITDPATSSSGRGVLEALQRYHYLTLKQLATVLGYSTETRTKWIEKTVRELANGGYVFNGNYLPKRAMRQVVKNATTGKEQTVYRVPAGGAPCVVSLLNGRRDPRVQVEYLEHVIPTNDVLIAFERFGVEAECPLLALFDDVSLHEHLARNSVIPDGYVAYQLGEHKAGFALEFDRGTEAYDDPKQANWKNKLAGYVEFVSGQEPTYLKVFPARGLKVAVVVKTGGINTKPSAERMRELIHWTERYFADNPAWGDFFRFTTADPTTMSPVEFVTGNHWTVPFTYEQVPLVDI